MAEEIKSNAAGLEKTLPLEVLEALRNEGVNLAADDVARAICITATAMKRIEEGKTTRERTKEEETIKSILRRELSSERMALSAGLHPWLYYENLELKNLLQKMQNEMIPLLNRIESQSGLYYPLAKAQVFYIPFVGIALVAAVGLLIAGFQTFATAIQGVLHSWNLARFFGLISYPQTVPELIALPNGIALAPVFAYVVYLLLTLGYVGCLFGVFFGSRPKDRSNAMEIVKTLTAFFIGSVTGKLI